MDFTAYIEPKYYIIVALLYGVGVVIKKTPNIQNWVIPLALSIIGAVLVTLTEVGAGNPMNIAYIIQGVICGLTSVGTNQIIKQTLTDKK